MVKLYVRRIIAGLMTIDDVPTIWKAEVQAQLGSQIVPEGEISDTEALSIITGGAN